jgi:hypothetical protein
MALAMKDLGHSDMRHALFGLVLVPLMMCGSVFAEDAPVAGADPSRSQAVQTGDKQPTTQKTRPPPGQMHHAKSSKPALPLSLPLAAATADPSGPSASLPIAPVPRAAPPAARPWTGFYVGAGAGVGTNSP